MESILWRWTAGQRLTGKCFSQTPASLREEPAAEPPGDPRPGALGEPSASSRRELDEDLDGCLRGQVSRVHS